MNLLPSDEEEEVEEESEENEEEDDQGEGDEPVPKKKKKTKTASQTARAVRIAQTPLAIRHRVTAIPGTPFLNCGVCGVRWPRVLETCAATSLC